MPCFLDKLSPDELAWPENARYRGRPFDFGKIWWSLRMAELGCAGTPVYAQSISLAWSTSQLEVRASLTIESCTSPRVMHQRNGTVLSPSSPSGGFPAVSGQLNVGRGTDVRL